eukprot:CAMPEP_0171074694 /NCGR_PEP_ID=MMETSP0766_2-20121228/12310_1 /TAXON_ID=439317 /ORGANISM="Gambierdiscus australes, Strain CAWD 149" /LENGTH=39 /DNA_ID= /DNA_START= /DNA_END= /DNA_ORIENTATION=
MTELARKAAGAALGVEEGARPAAARVVARRADAGQLRAS